MTVFANHWQRAEDMSNEENENDDAAAHEGVLKEQEGDRIESDEVQKEDVSNNEDEQEKANRKAAFEEQDRQVHISHIVHVCMCAKYSAATYVESWAMNA